MKPKSSALSAFSLRERIRDLDGRIERIDLLYREERRELEIRRTTLTELLTQLKPSKANGKPPRLTDKILEYVRENPGIRAKAVVDHFAGPDASEERRASLRQLIRNQVRRERLADDGKGLLTFLKGREV